MNKNNSDNVGVFFSAYLWLKEEKANHFERNTQFLRELGIPAHRHIYVSRATPTVIVLLTEEELNRARSDIRLEGWSPYGHDVPERASDSTVLTQIGADLIGGTNGMGYSGKGIRIGVISAEGLTYDPDAIGLRGADITAFPNIVPPVTDSHPTAVLSQIVGQEVTVDNRLLYGVVRDASLYFASTRTVHSLYQAIEDMLDAGVRIINYSAGIVQGEYSDLDRQIDRLISYGNFLFVTVSGNQRELSSPGRAENALTVGNAITKAYPDTPLPSPWNVWCYSEDDCSGFSDAGVHKPDLVAPGAWIGYGVTETQISFNNFGTSFAAPWVSGISAAVLEALGGEGSYLTLKGIILLSCRSETVSVAGNPTVTQGIRLRSGYGFLDGIRAVDIARNGIIFEGEGQGDYTLKRGSYELMFTFERGGNAFLRADGVTYPTGAQNTLLIKKRSESDISLSVSGVVGRFSLVIRSI